MDLAGFANVAPQEREGFRAKTDFPNQEDKPNDFDHIKLSLTFNLAVYFVEFNKKYHLTKLAL